MYQPVLPQRRPVGVTILAFLYLMTGVICLFLLLSLILFSMILKVHIVVPINMIEVYFVLLEGIASLIIGVGLWQTRRWAFWASIAREIVFIVGSLIFLFLFSSIPYQVSQVGFSIFILAYLLLSKNVHRAFSISRRPKNI